MAYKQISMLVTPEEFEALNELAKNFGLRDEKGVLAAGFKFMSQIRDHILQGRSICLVDDETNELIDFLWKGVKSK